MTNTTINTFNGAVNNEEVGVPVQKTEFVFPAMVQRVHDNSNTTQNVAKINVKNQGYNQ